MSLKTLIIVESPGKIKTLSKFLGRDYVVEASKGHVIDLPPSRIGVDPENGFVPYLRVVPDRENIVLKLQAAAKKVDRIYLAPDPDREGEAISWHLANILNIDPLSDCRVTFNSITKDSVLQALEAPRPIDQNLVSAQQSRRILDRLVGFKLSPLLWKKVCLGLSAGRVQSVAVLLICQREKEIMAFTPEEYWTISASLKTADGQLFQVKHTKTDGKKAAIKDSDAAHSVVETIKSSPISVSAVTRRNRSQTPLPPFITSTLQQEASQKYSFTSKRTMSIAQKLYEGVELGKEGQVGLITYMRTDSTRVSPEGLSDLRSFILENFEGSYSLKTPRTFPTKKGAQDAHEAIRPTSIHRTPQLMERYLKPEALKLYSLIWKRFTASQMAEAVYKVVSADMEVGGHTFYATGTTMVFPGYTIVYTDPQPEESGEDNSKQKMPELSKGQELDLVEVTPKQNFTSPPPRYSESMLIKTLEKEGIGRPSTYASIIDTVQARGYVKKLGGKFRPSDAAFVVTDILVKAFGDIINTGFTAKMENELDFIEEGKTDWIHVLEDFYRPFSEDLKSADGAIPKTLIETDCICPKCGAGMIIKLGRTGKFLACSAYPACKSTRNIPDDLSVFAGGIPQSQLKIREVLDISRESQSREVELTDQKCALCSSQMLLKTGRFGQFLACSNYPECKATKPIVKDTGVKCPAEGCEGQMLEKKSKRGRIFFGCSKYPACSVSTWNRPTGGLCPECSSPIVSHSTKKLGEHIKCSNKSCSFKKFPEGADNDE